MSLTKKDQSQYSTEDYLEIDPPISGQNFVCLSFVSPDHLIKDKQLFFLTHFMRHILTEEKLREQFYSMKTEDITYEKVDNLFQDYLLNNGNPANKGRSNEDVLNEKYNEKVDFQTNIRGLKVRGVYETRKEAERRASYLRKTDPNFNVFMGQIGYWLPWDPQPDKIADQEYEERELNELMKKYNENKTNRDIFYAEQKTKVVEDARKKNEEMKRKVQEEMKASTVQIDSEEVSRQKVSELRKIVDEKNHLEEEALKKNKEEKKEETSSAVRTNISPEDKESLFNGEDAWMQRKRGNNLPPIPPHQLSLEEESDKKLDEVSKNIF